MATLTRQELYDLVWAHPRTELAERLGVSDVAIGKACARENVPAPPRGHWARQSAGKPTRQPDLPIRTPAQSPVVFADDKEDGTDHAPPAAPVFVEDIDAQVVAALARISPFAWRRKLRDSHKALQRILASDIRRKLKAAETGLEFFGPRFSGAVHQRQLAVYNVICHALDGVWHHADLRAEDQPETLRLNLGYQVADVSLSFSNSNQLGSGRRLESTGVLTLNLHAGHRGNQDCHWQDSPEGSLESRLPSIVAEILRRAEASMRAWMVRQHLHQVERISKEAQDRRDAEAQRTRLQAEQDAAAEQAGRDDLTSEAARWHQATQIRAYIAHLDTTGAADADWRAWALRVADEMDPSSSRLRQR
jgi:hypothetical protein